MGGSSDDAGLFEFDQLSGSPGDDDPPDEPDRPDPPDDGGASNEPVESTRDGESDRDEDSARADESTSDGNSTRGSESTTNGESEPSGGHSPAGSRSGDGSSGESERGKADGGSGTDSPDPPDPSDGGTTFYEFDPVDESQKAFQFAEKQSRAAAESAYKHAAESLVGRFVQKYTSPEVRQRLDEVFSRRMLGSVFVGGAFSKILETSIEVYFGASSLWRPVTWLIIFSISTIVFVWWDHLARRASETAEKASEAAEKASEAASEAAEKASETAEKASKTAEMASEAATVESDDASETETAEVVGAGVANAVQNRDGGATAATRAGGKRPTAVRSRARKPVRQPNRRFEDGAGGGALGDGLQVDDAVLDGETDADAPPFERTGFRNPGGAETLREGSER